METFRPKSLETLLRNQWKPIPETPGNFGPKSAHVWVGPEQQFYIETQAGVVGVYFSDGDISWCESLVRKRSGERISLDGALERFKRKVDAETLRAASLRGEYERITKLCEIFVQALFFGPEPDAGCGISSIDIEGGIARFHFKNSPLPSQTGTGSAWIDLQSRQLLKAEVNGKQVYP